MKKYLTFILFLMSSYCYPYQYDLSICAIFKNEKPYLKEWIDYHLKHGVEHFWLYNNNSIDSFREILDPYIRKNIVSLIDWPSKKQPNQNLHFLFETQTEAYNHCLRNFGNLTNWLALIDIDEFIVTPNHSNIVELLNSEFNDDSGICVNWQCYGTSNIMRCKKIRNSSYILDELVWKMKWDHEWNKHSKSIVRPNCVYVCPNPYFCLYHPECFAVDSNHEQIELCCTSVNIDKIRINHYYTRDINYFFTVKIPRYLDWYGNADEFIKVSSEMNEEYDPILSHTSR